VQDHYANGSYEKLIQSISNRKGSANFIHEYRSVSLVMENLLSGANELLIPTTGGYDQRLKLENFKNTISTIESIFNISLNLKEWQ
jgi:hypothetical protein